MASAKSTWIGIGKKFIAEDCNLRISRYL